MRYSWAFVQVVSAAVLVIGINPAATRGVDDKKEKQASSGQASSGQALFNRDVRPILSNHCFQCHGPDQKHRKADLRLDDEAGVRQVFSGGLAESEAWRRLLSKDDDERMPPPGAHREVSDAELRVIQSWIELGAKWEGHWAFTPPRRPVPPALLPAANGASPRNPIDAFLQSELRRRGLTPNVEADKARLLRRVTFDLSGMPPTLEEMDAFLADESPNAYAKVVERLLADKRFGERMAASWMDLARYGDSSVFHADGPRDMWPWRDWVIAAYNSNKPFDQFTIEQLAGDLIPNATVEQKIATGFNRNNATTDEGGAIAEEYRVEYAVDRVKTTSMVWLGLTVECAQCHSHKYDPISQEDYYRFFAFFNQASDPGMQTRNGNQAPTTDVPNYLLLEQRDERLRRQQLLQQQIVEHRKASTQAYQAWLTEASNAPPSPSLPADPLLHFAFDEGKGADLTCSLDAKRKAKFEGKAAWAEGKIGQAVALDGASFVNLGNVANFERNEAFSYGAWIKPMGAGSGAPIARMDNSNSFRGFDLHLSNGHIEVHLINTWPTNAIKVRSKTPIKPDQWQHIFVTYDGSSKAQGVTIYLDGKPQAWGIEQDRLQASIRTKKPLHVGRRSANERFRGAVDDVWVYRRKLSAEEVNSLAGYDPIGDLLAVAKDKRTPAQNQALQNHYLRQHDKEFRKLSEELETAKKRVAETSKRLSTVMVMKDLPKPRMTYVLDRGSYDSPQKDHPVEPGVPRSLPEMPKGAPANRLGLAQWLVRPDHPLTARVAVNRYWYMLFGRGLVGSVENFGAQGEWPTHPALLDWMAVEFVESGWDIKHVFRLMVSSAAYRRSSRRTPALAGQDPNNLLLARGPRFRLPAEFIRNNALAASGLFVDRTGGPSVRPYQPPGLWNAVSLGGNVRFVQDKGEGLYRRGMYTYWKRSAPAPFLTLFDAPSREKCTIRRSKTNTPLQALMVLNDPQYVEASRALAQRVMQAEADPAKRIAMAYRLATGVAPSRSTLKLLVETHQQERAEFAANLQGAAQFLAIGDSKRDISLAVDDHAAMAVVCSIILNLDATLTRG